MEPHPPILLEPAIDMTMTAMNYHKMLCLFWNFNVI